MSQIESVEREIKSLEETLRHKRALLSRLKQKVTPCPYSEVLSSSEIVRYSRQIIMPQIKKEGQISLKNSKVLIVGAGGLGCPAALYLAAAGVGEIHIIDYDEVELSNLHRQILHFESDIGRDKVQSAFDKITSLNSDISVVPIRIHASTSITEHIQTQKYDVVLDCTDNAPTRYLLNDSCVFEKVPLVSGSALQMEGQLTVYNYKNGPCYRCLFPRPPPPHTVTNCGDGGVLGPVAGTIGVLQALETIKILLDMRGVLSGRLLIFDGTESTFRNVKLRQKMINCDVCSDDPKIVSPIDYEMFCGSKAHDKVVDIDVLKSDENVSVVDLPEILKNNLVIDVRSRLEYDMCKLPETVNLPITFIKTEEGLNSLEELVKIQEEKKSVYFLCRRGNDSQRCVHYLKSKMPDCNFINIKGGLHAYSRLVDASFPVY